MQEASIGVTGLAVMGRNLARNLARHGHPVAVHNRTAARTEELVAEFGHEGTFIPAKTPRELVAALRRPRRLIVMVKAGAPTDAVIAEFAPLLEPGDMIVDGGNAHFSDTRRRERWLREHGIHFVGTGISGGEEGALHGPSIMPGGSAESYRELGPLLEDIAAKVDGVPCCTHVGPDGAGHFVKMVHNGIEYADMQLIGEAYDLLRHGAGLAPSEIAEVFAAWNRGRLESYLIEITAQVLAHTDPATGRPFVDVVLDRAEQKGTGRWTVQTALELGVPVSGIAEAVFARALSGHAALRRAARALPGPRPSRPADAGSFADEVEKALYASKIVAYAQGFHQIQAGSAEYGWNIDPGAMATIWRGGCIIRARFLDRIRAAYAADPATPTLLADEYFAQALGDAQDAWRKVVATAAHLGIPAPGFATALSYYDALRAERLPAALTQAQRDFFGAHTYRRVDREGSYHTRWAGDRAEIAV
ncbi:MULTISPECIES: NADP-dependent phosphogluconate dehydrogenase [Thermomonospora]|uniref:6-phosphogluconate dehydrogenase, decarboxylating n=1 Tax=Thermomonospora curvata (strain ATCC 19995 / DSM 43183 / JCM 3096 / KCTC 9072 / NBRC 15933 / NCIMB 10081 / Henssen B9) TaxID=471852 RepID=D1A6V7_THECD|nr:MULTISPECIES: NADP-dependent phosphogluconate dehydrogenase [Thermomonospora]ACY98361.1 6-phosphogluconate dehydrogenase, decarboxylating [Thermomonospora curvata DSM 43183]PKK13522.1 MAG: phosphogluconate dehydrogenase (NADP(+)-dependent, decarboxylating) [Thermomonospora sp. CIF 1]